MGDEGPSLLRRLAGGVHPVGPGPDAAPAGPRDRVSLDFSAMLSDAADGRLRSDAPVRVPPALRGSIDDPDHRRLSDATDLAASEGIGRALVLFGGRMFRVDVPSRSVIDAPDAQQATITGVDGVVRADKPEPGGVADAGLGPARVVRNASLINALSRADGPGN